MNDFRKFLDGTFDRRMEICESLRISRECLELLTYQPDRLRRVDTNNSEAIVGSANIDEIAEIGRNDQSTQ